MIKLTQKRKAEIRKQFKQEVMYRSRRSEYDLWGRNAADDDKTPRFHKDANNIENDPEGNWGGYMSVETFPGSCGNGELVDIANSKLPVKTPDEMAFWLQLIKKTFKRYHLGNLFTAYPCKRATGKPYEEYTIISKALKKLGCKRIARSVNPYHKRNYQDTFCIHG